MLFIHGLIAVVLTTLIMLALTPSLPATNTGSLISIVLNSALALALFKVSVMAFGVFTNRQRTSKPIDGPRRSGSIKWFNTKKQYGFITTDDGEDIFIHKRFVQGDKKQRIRDGMRVEFSVSETEKGLQAEDVAILD
ncbi:MAG: cold shock domain-containing protein [Pseudomonadota bacterium]